MLLEEILEKIEVLDAQGKTEIGVLSKISKEDIEALEASDYSVRQTGNRHAYRIHWDQGRYQSV